MEEFRRGQKRNEPEEPILPPVSRVPDVWEAYIEALNVIVTTTTLCSLLKS